MVGVFSAHAASPSADAIAGEVLHQVGHQRVHVGIAVAEPAVHKNQWRTISPDTTGDLRTVAGDDPMNIPVNHGDLPRSRRAHTARSGMYLPCQRGPADLELLVSGMGGYLYLRR